MDGKNCTEGNYNIAVGKEDYLHGCGPAGAGADLNSPDLAADFISTVNQPSTAALA
ncbi:MAG TPA: hypothetical protein VNO18_24960 [Xanthobacteraceae bacterium]|nr:hypothetical protein [Xanthobacteraceae bacterium]